MIRKLLDMLDKPRRELARAAPGAGLASLLLCLNGCAVWERSLTAGAEVASDQEYQSLTQIVGAAGGDVAGLVADLSKTTTQEPALNADGSPMLDGHGDAIYRVVTRTERGFPMAPLRTRFSGGGKFVDAELRASIHNNADGAALDFNQSARPDPDSLGVGVAGQAKRSADALNAIVAVSEAGKAVWLGKFASDNHKITEEQTTARLGIKLDAETAAAEDGPDGEGELQPLPHLEGGGAEHGPPNPPNP